MDRISEKGFFYAHTYGLDKGDLYQILDTEISKLDLKGRDKKYNIKINVVKNKDDIKLGYTYFWINNEKIFNALIGLNYDGSERIEIIKKEAEENELQSFSGNWADLAQEEEVETTINKLDPLIIFPDLKLNEEDRYKYRIYNEEIAFYIEPTTIIKDYSLRNSLYARKVPEWLTEKKIKKYFECFEKDTRQHSRKSERFNYPIVKIKNSIVNVIFSNLHPNTASFVYNMTRIVIFKDTIIKDGKKEDIECLLKFKQNIKRD